MEQDEEVEEKKGKGNISVSVTDPKTKYVSTYSMSTRLKRNLDKKVIPDINKKDKDIFIIIDGMEGVGKSWFAFQLGKYIDPTLDLSRVVFSPDEFREAVLKAKKGQCVIYDEAFTGFSSRSSLSPINRVLVSLSMQMRQKNLCILIVLPTIFLLDKYVAMFRARALIHVFESHGKRGYFKVYNVRKKKLLILLGAKTMSYRHKGLNTHFKGRFYGKFALGDAKVEALYRKKKEKALSDSEKTSMSSQQVKFKEQRDLLIWLLRKSLKLSTRQMSNLLNDYDMTMSYVQISTLCAKFGDSGAIKEVKELKESGLEGISEEKSELNEGIEPKIDDLTTKEEEILDFDEDLGEKEGENELKEDFSPDNDDL